MKICAAYLSVILAFAPGVFAAGTAEEQVVSKTTTFAVKGMSCSACERTICGKLGGTAGVESCKADHKAGTAEVTYEPAKISSAQIVKIIDDLGYEASAPAK